MLVSGDVGALLNVNALEQSLEGGNRFSTTACFFEIGLRLSVLIEVPGLPNRNKDNPLIFYDDMVALLNAKRFRYTSLECEYTEAGGSKFTFLSLGDLTSNDVVNFVNQVNKICLLVEVLRSKISQK